MSEIHYHTHHHYNGNFPPALNAKIDNLMDLVNQLITNQKKIMLDVTALQTAVANETSLDQSVITLLNTLASELQAANNNNDQATINGIVATMQQNATALAAAVAANTPAAPAPAPAPAPAASAATTETNTPAAAPADAQPPAAAPAAETAAPASADAATQAPASAPEATAAPAANS